MKNYLIIIEKTDENFSAYAPDVPGCVATGQTPEETRKNMQEALQFHFKGLLEDGLPIPEPVTQCSYAEVS